MTQEALAEKSGFSQQYLSGLGRGQRNPTVVTLYELAQALGAAMWTWSALHGGDSLGRRRYAVNVLKIACVC